MPSPKRTDQDSSSTSERDGESTQDSEIDVNMKIKEEPADSGYEKAPCTPGLSENNSNSNSRTSSPCPPVHFGSVSPAQGRDSPSLAATGSSTSGPQAPLNDIYAGSTIRTQLQGATTGKKTDTVQNIVEGLLKKNATLLAMSDTEGLRPQRRQKGQDFTNNRKGDQNFPSVNSSAVFPVSTTSQARLVQTQGRKSETSKPMLLRPKSPTKKCDSILRDKSQLSYSLMESPVGDEIIEKIFKVQNHELVCAVSSKPYIFDKVNNEKTVVASLDNNYFWCNFCSFSSSNKSLITNHVTDHRFSCKFCPYESFCRSDILRHMSKMHEEFEELSNNLSYCTFLSDYIRVKSRADGKENDAANVDQDEDVGEVDTETLKSYHTASLKRKKELEELQDSVPSEKWAKIDSPGEAATNGPRSDRQGKSRKSQNPRRHPQVNEKDYDTFEMEVEEIDETENGSETQSDRILYPSSSENSNDHKNPPTPVGSHMQVIPSLQDEGAHGFTATHVARPPPPLRTGRPPTYMANNRTNNRATHRTASASSLYWSCGYCDFQSSSQAEIKEHSNRTHPGKPHRLTLKASSVEVEESIGNSTPPSDDDDDLMIKEQSFGSYDVLQSPCHVIKGSVNNVNKLDNFVDDEAAEFSFTQDEMGNYQSSKVPHDKYAKEIVANQECVSLSDSDNIIAPQGYEESRSTFCGSGDSRLSTLDHKDDVDIKDILSEGDHEDASVLRDDESCKADTEPGRSSSSLKLTFRTVGDTTVCSINENETVKDEDGDELEQCILRYKKEKSIAECEIYSKQLEEELVDSSSDSDSDISSNPRSVALSVSSISDDCNTIDSCLDLDQVNESPANTEKPKEATIKSEHLSNHDLSEGSDMSSPPIEKSGDLFHLTYVPARSAAVKAMTKMKPVIDDEVEDNHEERTHYSGGKRSTLNSITSKNAVYTCSYCNTFGASPLRKVKSHLANQHSSVLPIVINLRIKQTSKKKNTFYVCPFSSCNKLFTNYDTLAIHRVTHSASNTAKPKERLTVNSCGTACLSTLSSILSPPLHVPIEAENIPHCRVILHPLDKSELETLQLMPHSEPKEGERYECLYCTEHFSHSTLSGIKYHYATEHPDQLLVLRDVEAKKEKLASRIYACEESECEFISSSRVELDSHTKCHKSNCTFVYECAGCGWYSSSFWTARDHVKNEHAAQDNTYLIHMQLSVDENGHTSKKVLRSM